MAPAGDWVQARRAASPGGSLSALGRAGGRKELWRLLWPLLSLPALKLGDTPPPSCVSDLPQKEEGRVLLVPEGVGSAPPSLFSRAPMLPSCVPGAGTTQASPSATQSQNPRTGANTEHPTFFPSAPHLSPRWPRLDPCPCSQSPSGAWFCPTHAAPLMK